MKPLKLALVALLIVPAGIFITLAYLLGALIRWINTPEVRDEEEEPTMTRLHPKPHDGFWFY